MRGVEGEQFAARLDNPAQFVVLEPGRARPLVGAVGKGWGEGKTTAPLSDRSFHPSPTTA